MARSSLPRTSRWGGRSSEATCQSSSTRGRLHGRTHSRIPSVYSRTISGSSLSFPRVLTSPDRWSGRRCNGEADSALAFADFEFPAADERATSLSMHWRRRLMLHGLVRLSLAGRLGLGEDPPLAAGGL